MTSALPHQRETDIKNAVFWNELCGSELARSLGITKSTPESLRIFDEAYMATYPYLSRYVTEEELAGKRVLEIGLGYGTLGQLIASRGCQYHGLDIADIPYRDGSFDYVYSIGCLHHTGDLKKAVSEVHRVLVAGGNCANAASSRMSRVCSSD